VRVWFIRYYLIEAGYHTQSLLFHLVGEHRNDYIGTASYMLSLSADLQLCLCYVQYLPYDRVSRDQR